MGITLEFLAEEDEHDTNIVRIKIYVDSYTPLASDPRHQPYPQAYPSLQNPISN